jgi:hypothetical protein
LAHSASALNIVGSRRSETVRGRYQELKKQVLFTKVDNVPFRRRASQYLKYLTFLQAGHPPVVDDGV